MKSGKAATHVTPANGNIFVDLGFAADEAFTLQKRAQETIEEKAAIKVKLMESLEDWIKRENMKQSEVAIALGVPSYRVSDVVKKKTEQFTIDALIDMLMRTDQKVSFSIKV